MSKPKEFDWNGWRKLFRELMDELPKCVKSIECYRDDASWRFRIDEHWEGE